MTSPAPRPCDGISPILTIDNLEEELAFLQTALGGEVVKRLSGPNSELERAEVRLGDATVILQKGQRAGSVELLAWGHDIDGSYSRALSMGARKVREPHDEDRGKREAVLVDPGGIRWRITSVRKLSNSEIERRLREQRKGML